MTSFKHNKKRIGFGLLFFSLFSAIGIWFIFEPKIFIRNFLMKEEHIQFIGVLLFLFNIFMLISHIILFLNKKEAFIISDTYIIDNSRYESIGKIYFNEIYDVKRIKKNSLKIELKDPVFKNRKLNILQKFLLMLNNWNYKNSIILSSALMSCEIDVLESTVLSYINKYK